MKKYFNLALNNREKLLSIIIITLFLSTSKLFFAHSKYVLLFETSIKILLFLIAIVIPGFFLLKLIRKDYFDNNTAFILAIPTSITLFSSIFIILQIFKSPPFLYLLSNIIVTGFILVLAYKNKIIKEILNIDILLKYSLILIFMGAVMATSYLAVNTNNPISEVKNWIVPAHRGFHQLPSDNNLQYDTAMVFANYQPPWSWGLNNWTMGDRPPLLGVINAIIALSLATPAKLLFNIEPVAYPFWYYEIIGIILNLLFILPLTLIAKKIFTNKKIIYFIPLAILLNGFIFLNIYFTWPKLLGAYFALLSIAFLLDRHPTGINVFIIGWLWALAVLSHGGAILSLPVLLIFYSLFLLKTTKFILYLKYLMIFIVAFVLFQSPWTMYKKAHPSIDTVNLYYHYVPKEYWPSEGQAFAAKNTVPATIKFLQEHPLQEQFRVRWNNLKKAMQNNIPATITAMMSGNWQAYHDRLYPAEFFHPITTTGEVQILLSIAILLIYLMGYISKRDKLSLPFNINLIGLIIVFLLTSYLFNILIKWEPAPNHALPYLELVIAITIFAGISFSFHRIIMIFSLGLIGIRFFYYVIYSSLKHNYHVFDFFNIVIAISVIFIIYLANQFAQADKLNNS